MRRSVDRFLKEAAAGRIQIHAQVESKAGDTHQSLKAKDGEA